MQRPSIQLVTPDTQAQLDATRQIFTEYAEQLGVDLCFQNFDAELADLPGEYAGPHGVLLLALLAEAARSLGLRRSRSRRAPDVALAGVIELGVSA